MDQTTYQPRAALRMTILIVLGLLIASSFFYSGLFIVRERVYYQAAIAIIAIVTAVLMRTKPYRGANVADLLLLVVLVLYGVGIKGAASTYGAVNTLLLWVTNASIYFIFSRLDLNEAEKKNCLMALATLCAVIALFGLAAYSGVVSSDYAVLSGRLSVLLEYPNATASIFLMGASATLALLVTTDSRNARRYLLSSLILLFTALLLTSSRGAWLLFVLAVPMVALATGNVKKTIRYVFGAAMVSIPLFALMHIRPTLLNFIITAGVAIMASVLFETVIHTFRGAKVVAWILFVTILGGFLWGAFSAERYVIRNMTKNPSGIISFAVDSLDVDAEHVFMAEVHDVTDAPEVQIARVAIWVLAEGKPITRLVQQVITAGETRIEIPFVMPEGVNSVRVDVTNTRPDSTIIFSDPRIGGGIDVRLTSFLHKVLPLSLANRLGHVSYAVLASDGRMTFYKDAVKLFAAAPWFGQGGGTWTAAYPSVQSHLYGSLKAHSEPLEMILDIGLVGLLAFFGFLAIVFWSGGRAGTTNRILVLVCGVILMHSSVEFIGAYPSFYFVLFSLLGMTASSVKPLPLTKSMLNRVLVVALVLVAAGALIVNVRIISANAHTTTATMALSTADYASASAANVRALELTPWDPVVRLKLANLGWLDLTKDREINLMLVKGLSLEPFNGDYATMLGDLAYRHADYDSAISYMQKALAIEPCNVLRYESLAKVQAQAALVYMASDSGKGLAYAKSVLSTYDARQAKVASLLKGRRALFTDEFRLAIGQALLVVGDYTQAETHLKALLKAKVDSVQDKAAVTLARLYEKTNRDKAAKPLLERMDYRQDLNQYYSLLLNATR